MYGARPALPEHTEGELPAGDPLAAEFFAVPSAVVAPALIGKLVWVRGVGGGRLTEVEAYLPQDDPASHAARGPTRRNAAMFLPGGHVYLYRSYGVHVCLNVVCDREGVGSAVASGTGVGAGVGAGEAVASTTGTGGGDRSIT